MRPTHIPAEKFTEWENMVKNSEFVKNSLPLFPEEILPHYIETMVCAAYLTEELQQYNLSDDEKMKLDYTFGHLSVGKDCWEVAEQILFYVKNNMEASLIFKTTEVKALN